MGSISAAYKKHEDVKKRAYGQRVREIEHGAFTHLVFSTTGGMGQEATTFYKRLADTLARKQQKPYSVVISWLRCKLSFAVVRSSIMCIRGTRSSNYRPLRDADIILATSEGYLLCTQFFFAYCAYDLAYHCMYYIYNILLVSFRVA